MKYINYIIFINNYNMALEPENTTNMITDRVKQLLTVQNEARALFEKKNADYGDSFATYGTLGVLVRIGDKINRLNTITSRGINFVEDESLRDTLIDLHNYSAMGIMLLDNTDKNTDKAAALPLMSFNKNIVNEWEINEWEIKGSTGNIYKRTFTRYPDGKIINTCSCPSFTYCLDENKNCKHIIKEYKHI